MNTEILKIKLQQKYGDKYDYSKVEYINYQTKICIICPIHGEFYKRINHLFKNGELCHQCSKEKHFIEKKRQFIQEAKAIYGDKYDYSKVEYKGNKVKVCITCPTHGKFWVVPTNHVSKHNKCGCPKCSKKGSGENGKLTLEEFIERAKKVHGDKYDYSKVNYVNNSTKVCIICPIHGEFWQTPNSHLHGKGCRKCGVEYLKNKFIGSTEGFIEKAKKVHGNKYDYSKVKYKGAKEKVCIICPVHGEFWQAPTNHLAGSGCLLCNRTKNENIIGDYLNNNNIFFEREKRFKWLGNQRIDYFLPYFNVGIEYQGEQHFHPVKHFGGEKRYKDQLERDARKKKLCEEHNIKLFYISFYKYASSNVYRNMEELIEDINNI